MKDDSENRVLSNFDSVDFEKLRKTVFILFIPVVFIMINMITGGVLPKFIIYAVSLAVGFFAFVKSFQDPELILAAFIFYIPMAKEITLSIAPMVNGTNIFFLFLLLSLIFSRKEKISGLKNSSLHKYVMGYAIISSFSAFTTIVFVPAGLDYLLNESFFEYKAWIDQFVLYVLIFKCVGDNKGLAKRVFFYMVIGTILTELYTSQEMLEKLGRSTIEKSRIDGPMHQPNDLGAFLVYTSSMLIAIFVVNIKNIKVWFLIPYFLFLVKLLLTTFSRGAYLGFAAVGLTSSYVKGKKFLGSIAVILVLAIFLFPELMPNSLRSRMNQTSQNDGLEKKMDKSSEHRLILWQAAIKMTAESPLIGKGFKAFRYHKSNYTETPVIESDTHNMYLYVSSQMGIPALVLFVLILMKLFFDGRHLYIYSADSTGKMIGLSASSMSAGVALVNMFGSRMINIEVCGYVWIMIVVVNVLNQRDSKAEGKPSRRDKLRRGRSKRLESR